MITMIFMSFFFYVLTLSMNSCIRFLPPVCYQNFFLLFFYYKDPEDPMKLKLSEIKKKKSK